MKKLFSFLIFSLTISLPVNAFHEGKLSCLYTRWCRNNVERIKNINDVKREFPNYNYDNIADEFNQLINNLKRFRVKVFLADKKYFPEKTIGIYNVKNNNIYLNKKYMHNEVQLIRTSRHEAWHVAQDCKTGIRSGSLGIILNQKYISEAVDYERGAIIASRNKGMAEAALESCYTNDNIHIIRYLED
tara:strand:+ start:1112 stop:1675 length:564 start_codon:yes stop_codon:yes gene_type:complete